MDPDMERRNPQSVIGDGRSALSPGWRARVRWHRGGDKAALHNEVAR